MSDYWSGTTQIARTAMKRTSLNFLIDTLAFAGLSFLATTGMVLVYQLPPGSGGREGFGSGRGASERSIQLLWGLTRHEWGDIHYWTALVLMGVLTLHLFLHWKWIVGVIRGKPTTASPLRLALGILGLVSVILLTAIPLMSSTRSTTRNKLQDRGAMESEAGSKVAPGANSDSNPLNASENGESRSASIRGSMTLQEIATATGTTVAKILEDLHLPKDTDPNETAGRVMRQHGLQMSDLRRSLQLQSEYGTGDSSEN